jgi:transposase
MRCSAVPVASNLSVHLPDTLDGAHQVISVQSSKIANLTFTVTEQGFEIKKLKHQLEQLLRSRFGKKADRLRLEDLPLLFDQQEINGNGTQEDKEAPSDEFGYSQDKDKGQAPTPKKGHGRRAFPAELPRKVRIIDLPEEQKRCSCCGALKCQIGEERTERLDYEPAKFEIIQEVRPSYACTNKACDSGVSTAPAPYRPIQKSYAEPGLLAHIVVSKYADHQPLHRQEDILARHGLEISRKTMSDWMVGVAGELEPLYQRMSQKVLSQSHCIGVDETGVNVQVKGGPGIKLCRLWACVGDQEAPYTVYHFSQSRESQVVLEQFKDYQGTYFQADACSVYEELYRQRRGRILEVGCWAHARRKFIEAQESDPGRALKMVVAIGRLYQTEREAAGLSPPEREKLRARKSRRRLGAIKRWLIGELGQVLPKSPMSGAIQYCLRNWEALTRYLSDGNLEIDNNRTERALRTIALGRKNWLFCGSDRGGKSAAILNSLITSAKRHGLEIFYYIRDLLQNISSHPMSRLDELLPDRWAQMHPDAPRVSPSA